MSPNSFFSITVASEGLSSIIAGKSFIRNVNDTDPVLGLYDDFSEYRKTSGQPRVIGVRVRYKF